MEPGERGGTQGNLGELGEIPPTTRRDLYRLLGEFLEYPGPDLVEKARRCRDLLLVVQPEVAEPLAGFVSFVDSVPPGQREEVYTSTFDLNPVCCPYAGHQLLGDDPKRAVLMVGLLESYRAAGFTAGKELPDHVAVLLKFLAHQEDPELERDLVVDLLAPTLEKMAALAERNPYGGVLRTAMLMCRDLGPRGGSGGLGRLKERAQDPPRSPLSPP